MKLTLHDVCYVRFANQMYFMSQMKTAFLQYLFSSSKICLPQHRHLLQVVHRLFHVDLSLSTRGPNSENELSLMRINQFIPKRKMLSLIFKIEKRYYPNMIQYG